jgi:hypothetical protein
MPGLFDGHPDDWWAGHDWEHWWSRLSNGDRTRLLELGWGDEPAPLLGIILTSLRGATYESRELTQRLAHGCPEVVEVRRQRATDEFLIWLEEKRADRDR